VDLLGFSTGGRAATRYVQEHPDDPRRLVLASTSAYDSSDNEPYLRDWDEYRRRREIERAAGGALENSTIFVWDVDLAPGYLALLEGLGQGDWSYDPALGVAETVDGRGVDPVDPGLDGVPDRVISSPLRRQRSRPTEDTRAYRLGVVGGAHPKRQPEPATVQEPKTRRVMSRSVVPRRRVGR